MNSSGIADECYTVCKPFTKRGRNLAAHQGFAGGSLRRLQGRHERAEFGMKTERIEQWMNRDIENEARALL